MTDGTPYLHRGHIHDLPNHHPSAQINDNAQSLQALEYHTLRNYLPSGHTHEIIIIINTAPPIGNIHDVGQPPPKGTNG